MEHETTASLRCRIDSNRNWLRASPREWVHNGSGMTETSVAVNGAGLVLGTCKGKLAVVKVGARDMQEEETPTGLEVPVAFAVIPANADVATARQSNRVVVESSPCHGEAYGAGEDIAIRAEFGAPIDVQGNPTLALTVNGIRIPDSLLNASNADQHGLGQSGLVPRWPSVAEALIFDISSS